MSPVIKSEILQARPNHGYIAVYLPAYCENDEQFSQIPDFKFRIYSGKRKSPGGMEIFNSFRLKNLCLTKD